MTATSGVDRDRAEGEATTWLVRLSEGQGDAELQASFEAWRSASPLNAETWERARVAYDLIGKGEPRHSAHWQHYAGRRREQRALPAGHRMAAPAGRASRRALPARRRLRAGLAIAACIALVIGISLPGLLLRVQADVVTRTAEVRSITLEDGSRIALGPESALDVVFIEGERLVRLIKGDAFFEISPDNARPFRVEAGDTVVTVLGTAFEVRRAGDGTRVAVQYGRVRVDDARMAPATAEMLEAGEWVHVPRHGQSSRGRRVRDDIAPWLHGKLVALNRPAGEVVDDLRRYVPGVILIQDREFAERRVSGIYDLGDPRKTLRDLASSHGAKVRHLSDWLLVITAGNE